MNLCRFFGPRDWTGMGYAIIFQLFGVCLIMALTGTAYSQKNPNLDKILDFARANYGTLSLQKNGVIKSNLKLGNGDNVREGRTTTRFIRKAKLAEDLVMLELELPDTRFTMAFDGEKTWGTSNGDKIELAPELASAFRASYLHSYEALLRYKDDGSKVDLVDTRKMATLEVDIIDLTMVDGTRTRYEVSRRSGHVLALEYETTPATPDTKPVKYRLNFRDFKLVQNTIVIPYKTIVYENGVQVEERTIIEAAFNAQLEEKLFRPDAPPDRKETPPSE